MTDPLACETCDETGEVPVGRDNGSWLSPPETIYEVCPVCGGAGIVTLERLDEWDGIFPDPEYLVQYFEDRRYYEGI